MIQLEITAVHFELNPRLQKYAERKIGKLDRYMPRGTREPAVGHVILTEEDGKSKNRFTCEVNITLPHGNITAKEATVSIYAAIDIVEAKVKAQLLKYKSKVTDHRKPGGRRRGRFPWLRR